MGYLGFKLKRLQLGLKIYTRLLVDMTVAVIFRAVDMDAMFFLKKCYRYYRNYLRNSGKLNYFC